MEESPRTSSRALARVHSLTGVLPLGIYLVLHLGETGEVGGGRRGFVAALTGASGDVVGLALEVALVLVPLAVHAILGLVIAFRDRAGDDPGPHPSRAMRAIQRATGLVALLFIAVHLSHTFALELRGHDAAALYEVLRLDLGTPLHLGVYSVGLACVAAHFALGVPAALRRFEIVTTAPAIRSARIAGALIGVVLFMLSVNTVSHFAVGRAFIGGGPAPAPASEPVEEQAP